MFYSEAILSKKGPLAKVWLAAHWERKLSKTQFLQTNIQTSVGAILGDDQPPMALRLSGQLLLGVARIYSRKAKYLLEDCNEALLKIKMAFRPGEVDIPEDQRIASFESITLPDNITEFDILMPDLGLHLRQWTEIAPVSCSNISRPQDITIRDDFELPLDLNVVDDLLGDADDRDFDLNLDDDDLDQKATGKDEIGSHSHEGDESISEIEIARDAQKEAPLTAEDVIGKSMENDPLMIMDDGPELRLDLDMDLDMDYTLTNDTSLTKNFEDTNEHGNVDGMDIDVPVNFDENSIIQDNLEGPIFSPASQKSAERQEDNLQDTQSLQDPQETQDLTELQEPQESPQELQEQERVLPPRTQVRRKRRLMVLDEVTELPNRHIKSQIDDTSDICIESSYLPISRKLLRLAEIRQMGAWYFLDLTAPHNIRPELRYLFARKRQRVSKDNDAQPGPSGTSLNIDTDTFNNNDDSLPNYVPEAPNFDKETTQDVDVSEQTKEKDLTQDKITTPSEHEFDNHFDNFENDISTSPTEGLPNIPNVTTIFDQDEPQDQQNTGNSFSRNTVKAMRLLKSKCLKQDDATSSTKPKQTILSFEGAVGTAKRQDAVKLFFELLVLNTKDVIHVQQKHAYGDIAIVCKK
ncbi:9067_t:CDS:10 [Funneliformis mosseae]|uniref:9067_t:CDS:1 n=1 Tax=Funneliformis mosseae TaxID=27381 RepID=A0A9N9FAE4_FUNMO|nr:9067_t:CDS:10 [Funneliformis mosseae]